MFGKFKDKLKGWFKKSEEKAEVEETKGKKEKSGKKEKKEKNKEIKVLEKFKVGKQKFEPDLEKLQEQAKQLEKKESKGKGWFKFKINENYFNEIFSELELVMLENNVAYEAVEKIKSDLKQELIGKQIKKKDIESQIKQALKKSIENLFPENIDLIKKINEKKEKPYVMVFFGINGSGKTTSIAKIANYLKKNNKTVVLAASDTFRAASIEQLEKHGENLDIKVIKGQYGNDPSSVAFDAIKHGKARKIDVVLIDTAGRMHTESGLLKEMEKISRISNPDFKIFVAESVTGNDAVSQAKAFHENIGIDGIILSKADVDEKGGTAISVSYVTKKPILFLGTGQEYKNLEKFDKNKLIKQLGLE